MLTVFLTSAALVDACKITADLHNAAVEPD